MSISKNADKGSTDPSNKVAGDLDNGKGSGKRFDHGDRTGTSVDNTGNLGGSSSKKK